MSNISDPQVLDVLRNNHLCVLSTLGPDGEPQSALVGFAEDNEGNLNIGTSNLSRKYQNVIKDGRVSVVIGGFGDGKTLQIQGNAHEAQGDEWSSVQAVHVAKHEANEKFKDMPNETYIVIEPTWVRLTDATELPWKVTEWQA